MAPRTDGERRRPSDRWMTLATRGAALRFALSREPLDSKQV